MTTGHFNDLVGNNAGEKLMRNFLILRMVDVDNVKNICLYKLCLYKNGISRVFFEVSCL